MLASFLPELTINFQCCGCSLVSPLPPFPLPLPFITLPLPTCLPQNCNCQIALRVFLLFFWSFIRKNPCKIIYIFNVFAQIFSRNSIEVFLAISVLFHFLFPYFVFFFFSPFFLLFLGILITQLAKPQTKRVADP